MVMAQVASLIIYMISMIFLPVEFGRLSVGLEQGEA